MHYTFRCWTKEKLEQTKEKLAILLSEVCQENNLQFSTEYIYYFAASSNDSFAVDCIEKAAEKLNFSYHEKPIPFEWGEDFGLFMEHFPGAMFGLGAGENRPALHHADYDFPDEIISFGIEMFYGIAEEVL